MRAPASLPQHEVTAKVHAALQTGAFLTTNLLCRRIGCGPAKIIEAYDTFEAAGIQLMRVPGQGGGEQFVGKRMRRTA